MRIIKIMIFKPCKSLPIYFISLRPVSQVILTGSLYRAFRVNRNTLLDTIETPFCFMVPSCSHHIQFRLQIHSSAIICLCPCCYRSSSSTVTFAQNVSKYASKRENLELTLNEALESQRNPRTGKSVSLIKIESLIST